MKEKTAPRLFVFVPPHRLLPAGKLTASTVVGYVALGASPQSGETPIALLPKAAAVDLVFDCADVFVSAIDAPKLSEAKLRQALPNLLEDRLLSESSDLHYAYLPAARASGATTLAAQPKLAVAAVDRGMLTRALDALGECGMRPRAAYSEIYTVPAPEAGVLSVRIDRGRGIARSGRHEGFAFDFDGTAVPAPLALAVRQLGVKRIWAFGREAARLAPFGAELGVQIEDAQRELEPSAAEAAVNLLQGPFAPGGLFGGLSFAGLPKVTRAQLRAPLAWLAAAGVTFVVGMNAYYLKLDHEARALRSQMETAFRSAFPEASAVVDPVLQTQRQLSALRARAGIASADDFSVLNAQAAQLLSSAPLGIVAGLEYRDGALKIKFKPGTADNPGLQNALRAQAVQQGLNLRFEGDNAARLAPSGG
ncbi:MAG: type II secretion system protein GspL [Burkholderiaceae bacterium]|nr:type II secretion system protein GspL [Burkholderiaceae bacterium]